MRVVSRAKKVSGPGPPIQDACGTISASDYTRLTHDAACESRSFSATTDRYPGSERAHTEWPDWRRNLCAPGDRRGEHRLLQPLDVPDLRGAYSYDRTVICPCGRLLPAHRRPNRLCHCSFWQLCRFSDGLAALSFTCVRTGGKLGIARYLRRLVLATAGIRTGTIHSCRFRVSESHRSECCRCTTGCSHPVFTDPAQNAAVGHPRLAGPPLCRTGTDFECGAAGPRDDGRNYPHTYVCVHRL